MPAFHTTFGDLLHAVNLRHGTNGFTSLPKEGVLRIFFALKNPTASAGFESANLDTKGQHATSRPPKLLFSTLTAVFLTLFSCLNLNLYKTFHSLGTPRCFLHTTSLILSHLVPSNWPLSSVSQLYPAAKRLIQSFVGRRRLSHRKCVCVLMADPKEAEVSVESEMNNSSRDTTIRTQVQVNTVQRLTKVQTWNDRKCTIFSIVS